MIDNYNQVKSIISDWPFSYIYEKGASKSLGLSAKHGLSSTDRDVFFEMAKVRLTKKVELSIVPGRGIGMKMSSLPNSLLFEPDTPSGLQVRT